MSNNSNEADSAPQGAQSNMECKSHTGKVRYPLPISLSTSDILVRLSDILPISLSDQVNGLKILEKTLKNTSKKVLG